MFYVPAPVSNSIIEADNLESKSTSSKYETEWHMLTNEKNLRSIQKYVICGNLQSTTIRSIYWQVLSGIFPLSSDWVTIVGELRDHYKDIKTCFTVDPHQSSCVPDDNPLSLDKNSIWYRYFCDKELKRIIQQDVVRTYSEKSFFQSPHIQEIMINILFYYARQNPDLCYRQGMHEILALIIRVLHADYQRFQQEKRISVINPSICVIMDLEYLEPDTYFLFSFIMSHITKYYRINNVISEADGHIQSPENANSISFICEDDSSDSEIYQHLYEMRDNVLAVHDRQLYTHLKSLKIPFTAFGIRWLRLLFGREFSFDDLLLLWDAIFAVDSDFALVNYVVIAILIVSREKLLNSDFMQCLNYLMKYPSTIDVRLVINYAIYLKDPKNCIKPTLPVDSSSKCSESQISSNNVDKTRPLKSNSRKATVKSISIPKKMKSIKASTAKKNTKEDFSFFGDFSSKTFEVLVTELKQVRVVMSLCKLKLRKYHDVLAESVPADDVEAQHALVGIQELCTLLDFDQFALKSSNSTSTEVETAREAGEVQPSSTRDHSPIRQNATVDLVALYLPPPNTDIDMTIFKQIESGTADVSTFPSKNPHKHRYDC